MKTPKKKSGGATRAARSESCNILLPTGYGVNHVLVRWRREAATLFSEYHRTRHLSHVKAFRIHRAAMGGRLRSCMTA